MVVEKQYPLDSCQLFYDVKLQLESYSDETKNLRSIIYFSGNETHITEVCQRVFSALQENELIVEYPHEFRPSDMVRECVCPEAMNDYRGLFVLLLVNTATEIPSSEATWSMTCVHLVTQLPLMPQFLTVAIYLRCAMSDVLGEFLACGPRWITNQYFETLNQVLGKLCKDPMDIIPHLWSCLRAAVDSIVFHNIPEANEVLIRHIAGLLQKYLVDSQDTLGKIHPDRRSECLAESMAQIMHVIIKALDEETVKQEKPSYYELYSELSNDLCTSYDPDPRPDLRRLANVLMDALQRVLQLVSVNVYMDWVDLKSPILLYNYQELISTQSAALFNAMKKPENSELAKHSICVQLKPFKGNIKSMKELITELTLGDLLVFLDGVGKDEPSKEGKVAALDELFRRSIAFGNEECVWTMHGHLDLLNVEHCRLILKHLGQVVSARKADELARITAFMDVHEDTVTTNSELTKSSSMEDITADNEVYEPLIRLVFRPIYFECTKKEKISILEMRDELGVSDYFDFEVSGHNKRRILFFNQLKMNGAFPMTDFLWLCYEKPNETWLDLARLGMTHEQFAMFFWRVASHCPRHASFYIINTTGMLLIDEPLLLKPNAQNFLLTLYFHNQILNGLRRNSKNKFFVNLNGDKFSYNKKNLELSVHGFLRGCGTALHKFGSEILNYQAIEFILNLMMEIDSSEKILVKASREQLKNIERDTSVSPQVLQEANNYAEMHANMREYRLLHWGFMIKMVNCMDQLRWNLSNFDPERVRILGIAVKYWKRNMPFWMYLDDKWRKIITKVALVLDHSKLYVADELKVKPPNYPGEFIGMLTQASAEEATILFRCCLVAGRDQVIWDLLSKLVKLTDSATAYGAFSFLFRRYLIAFRKHYLCRIKKKIKFPLNRLMAIVALSPPPVRQETRKQVEKMILWKPGQRSKKAKNN
ncbi:hypothetical protein KR074_002315 [Drosophila pseudoananassae]|nr:hypothetical protein KR074_002315 [Drosophila pseudoananassae]